MTGVKGNSPTNSNLHVEYEEDNLLHITPWSLGGASEGLNDSNSLVTRKIYEGTCFEVRDSSVAVLTPR